MKPNLCASLMAATLVLTCPFPLTAQVPTTEYNGPFTHITGTVPNLSYDTGGELTVIPQGPLPNTYTGPLYLEGGAGGVILANSNNPTQGVQVDFGGNNAPLDWGQSGSGLPGNALILGGDVFLENEIDLGNDPAATRQIDIDVAGSGTTAAFMEASILGIGNLVIQNYVESGSYNGAVPTLYVPANQASPSAPSVDITGQLTLNNVALWAAGLSPLNTSVASAGSYSLSGATLEAPVASGSAMSLSNGSSWLVNVGGGSTAVTMQTLNSDSTSVVSYHVGTGSAPATSVTVHNGYFAGQFQDGNTSDQLIKDGDGILTLAGNSTTTSYGQPTNFNAATVVKSGTLLVANTTGSATGGGTVTVMSGAKLGGNGAIAPLRLEVQSGGEMDLTAFDPAHQPSSLTNTLTVNLPSAGTAVFGSGATFGFDLGSGLTSDKVNFAAGIAIPPFGSQTQVSFNNNEVDFNLLNGATAGTYTLFTFHSVSEYTGTLENGTADGYDYIFNYNAKSITVTLEEAPEPTIGFYMAGGVAVLAMMLRRRRGPA